MDKKFIFRKKFCSAIGRKMGETLHKQPENINSDQNILSNDRRLQETVLSQPVQQKIPRETIFSKSQEIQEMFTNGPVRKLPHNTHQFLSNLFLVGNKDR